MKCYNFYTVFSLIPFVLSKQLWKRFKGEDKPPTHLGSSTDYKSEHDSNGVINPLRSNISLYFLLCNLIMYRYFGGNINLEAICSFVWSVDEKVYITNTTLTLASSWQRLGLWFTRSFTLMWQSVIQSCWWKLCIQQGEGNVFTFHSIILAMFMLALQMVELYSFL
jgi:hypothetical protein